MLAACACIALLACGAGNAAAASTLNTPATPTLHTGSEGLRVELLQRRLAQLGYLAPQQITGVYGNATTQAVMALQGWQRLSRDGAFGPRTRAAARTAQRPTTRFGPGRRIEVRLDRQVALLVVDGRVARALHISTGAAGSTATPAGSYRITRKERMSWSRPFHQWLPLASYFVGGIAFHEYPSVPGVAASHGCVRVPAHEAKLLYRFASMGTRVLVR